MVIDSIQYQIFNDTIEEGSSVGQQIVLQARIDSDYIKTYSFVSPCFKEFICKHTIIMNSNPDFDVFIYLLYIVYTHMCMTYNFNHFIWQSINEKVPAKPRT